MNREKQTPQQLATRPSLLMLAAPPEDPAECDRIGAELWIGLTLRYQQIASTTDLDLLRNLPQNPGGQQNPGGHREYPQALQRFDKYILGQFAEWGWRMLLSKEVVRILARWETLDPEMLEAYGQKLALKSRIYRGEKSAPLLDGIENFADGVIAELQSLLRLQRDEFHRRPAVAPRCDRIAEWIRLEVEARPADFPKLHAHIAQLHAFVGNYLPTQNERAARELESGRMRAASFFYQWYAASSNRSVRDVRNLISSRRTKKLSSSK